jgi:chromosome segregation ATPase
VGGTVADWIGHAIAIVCLALLFVDRWQKRGEQQGTSTTTVAELAQRVGELERDTRAIEKDTRERERERHSTEVADAKDDGRFEERVITLQKEIQGLREKQHDIAGKVTKLETKISGSMARVEPSSR